MWWLKSGSYAILKTFENVNVNSIYISFKTNQLSGMLLYKPGTVSGKLFVFFFPDLFHPWSQRRFYHFKNEHKVVTHLSDVTPTSCIIRY